MAMVARLASIPRPAASSADKRSLATLAKNGQLPPREDYGDSQWTDYKRNIGSLARSGHSVGVGKRNVGTLARDYVLPNSGKRNLPSILRSGGSATSTSGQQQQPTRSVALLVPDGFYPLYRKRDDGGAGDFRTALELACCLFSYTSFVSRFARRALVHLQNSLRAANAISAR